MCIRDRARTLYVHLDGFRNDYVQREDWDTPVFDALISGGTRCTNAWGEYVSMTTANMTTLCTGAHTGTHQAVSYTHLDVYKRQTLGHSVIVSPCATHFENQSWSGFILISLSEGMSEASFTAFYPDLCDTSSGWLRCSLLCSLGRKQASCPYAPSASAM